MKKNIRRNIIMVESPYEMEENTLIFATIVLMTSASIPLLWQENEFDDARQLGSDNHHRKKFLCNAHLWKRTKSKFIIFRCKKSTLPCVICQPNALIIAKSRIDSCHDDKNILTPLFSFLAFSQLII
jgi:hypothetical protein